MIPSTAKMSRRKAFALYRVWQSLVEKHGWSPDRVREQLKLDYSLTDDEYDQVLRIAGAR
jgi:hypothetical protein